jgi:DNA helicase IV
MAASITHSLVESALHVRERNRLQGRPLSRRAVGSTLLPKGLETDIAVILNPAQMDANNLYVAMTRGARRLVICSETPTLGRRR